MAVLYLDMSKRKKIQKIDKETEKGHATIQRNKEKTHVNYPNNSD